jgi:hypothetical protein
VGLSVHPWPGKGLWQSLAASPRHGAAKGCPVTQARPTPCQAPESQQAREVGRPLTLPVGTLKSFVVSLATESLKRVVNTVRSDNSHYSH